MSQHTSPLQPPSSSPNPDNFVDMFADVSQHGSSLFEFFPFSTPTPNALTQPSFLLPPQPPNNLALQSNPSSVLELSTSKLPNSPYLSSESLLQPGPTTTSTSLPLTTAAQNNGAIVSISVTPGPPTPRRTSRRKGKTASSQLHQSSIAKPPHHSKLPAAISPRPAAANTFHDESDASDISDEQVTNMPSKQSHGSSQKQAPPSSTTQKQSSQHQSNADSSVLSEPPVKHSHNSHTRRCRAKVNSKFKELLEVLPPPPPETGVKHKAQILEYTIRIYRDYHARKTSLEAELALSSRSHLNGWVEGVVARALSLQDLLAPYLRLICTKGGWKYSEAWVSSQDTLEGDESPIAATDMSANSRLLTPANAAIRPNSKLRLGLAIIPSLGNTDDPDLQTKLERFRDKSRSYGCKARFDLPGRVLCTRHPEWLPSLEDSEVFQRARLASEASLVMGFGVPVFVRSNVAAVAMFFDTERRPYDAKFVDLANDVASLLGESYGSPSNPRSQVQ